MRNLETKYILIKVIDEADFGARMILKAEGETIKKIRCLLGDSMKSGHSMVMMFLKGSIALNEWCYDYTLPSSKSPCLRDSSLHVNRHRFNALQQTSITSYFKNHTFQKQESTIRSFIADKIMDQPFNISEPINSRWKIIRKIGSGTYGIVFKAMDIHTGQLYAVKTEKYQWLNLLSREIKAFASLSNVPSPVNCFPRMYFNGYHHGHSVMVMDLLGPSLYEVQQLYNGKIPIPMLLKIAKDSFEILNQIHDKGIMHNDIQPSNLVLGRNGSKDCRNVFVIDFGMADTFRDARGAHLRSRFSKRVFSTREFGSITAHKRRVLSRRDDIECIIYTLVYLSKGSLPWSQFVRQNPKPEYADVIDRKVSVAPAELFSDLPLQFMELWKYFKSLRFSDEPDYPLIQTLFTTALAKLESEEDGGVIWFLKYSL